MLALVGDDVVEDLIAYTAALGIDPDWAAQALLAHTFAGKVRQDFINGVRDDSGPWVNPALFLQVLESAAEAATAER